MSILHEKRASIMLPRRANKHGGTQDRPLVGGTIFGPSNEAGGAAAPGTRNWRTFVGFCEIVTLGVAIAILVLAIIIRSNQWGPLEPCPDPCSDVLGPTPSATCADGDSCTADWLYQGACQNPRLPAGTDCISNCYTGATTCDPVLGCVGLGCVGDCNTDDDMACPGLTWLGDAALEQNHRSFCNMNGSACQYYVKLDLPEPFDDFSYPSCPNLPWTIDKCNAQLDRADPYYDCLQLSTTCARPSPFFGNFHLFCHWHFSCSSWTCTVDEVTFESI